MSADFAYLKAKYFGLDPLFSTHVKLFLGDVLALTDYPDQPGVFAVLNHPVQTVHVMGDVVLVDHRRYFTSYSIDDGTGSVECIRWYNKDPVPRIRLGQLVSVYGKLVDYRGARQIRVYQIFAEGNPNTEVLHMAAILRLKSTVYKTPFSMPVDLVRYQEGEDKKQNRNPKEVIVEILKKWLQRTTPDCFSMEFLCKEQSLMEEVRTALSGSGKLMEMIKTSLQQLLKDDALVVNHLENGDVVFKYIDDERDLKPAVLAFISSHGRGPNYIW
jgi:hypothetical protein